MERTLKCWGERWLIRQDSTHATSYLKLTEGTRCSWHRHAAKFNLFVVLEGRIGIRTDDGEVLLGPGECFTVKPGEWHEFCVYEISKVIEEMYAVYNEEDIERQNQGGKLSDHSRGPGGSFLRGILR